MIRVPRETFRDGRIVFVADELPLGYICQGCGRWIPTLAAIDPECRHDRVELVENVSAERLMAGLAKAGYLRIPLPDEPEIHDDEYGRARDFERVADSLPPDFRL